MFRKNILSHLDPELYRKIQGCDSTEFSRKFKLKELKNNCKNIHNVKIGQLLGIGTVSSAYEEVTWTKSCTEKDEAKCDA